MAKGSRVADDAWHAARLKWESGELSVQQVADSIGVSKALVMKRKAAEGWVLGHYAPTHDDSGSSLGNPKVTGIAGDRGTQAGSPNGHQSPEPARTPPRLVADVFVLPSAAQSHTNAYADEIRVPDGLDEWEREEFIKQAIVERQKAINGRHLKELAAARSKLYASLKAAGTKEGPGSALAAQRNVAAMVALHGAEVEAELQRVRLEVAEFVGKPLKPTPCRIVVHLEAGRQIVGGVGAVYGPHATDITDVEAS